MQLCADILHGSLRCAHVAVAVSEALDDDYVVSIEFPDQRGEVQRRSYRGKAAEQDQGLSAFGASPNDVQCASSKLHQVTVLGSARPLLLFQDRVGRCGCKLDS